MSLVYCLMMMIASFMVYEQLKIAGSSMANLRITENSINRANEIDDVPVMDEKGRTITPDSHNIQFHDVTFSYEKRPVLKSVSLTIPDKSLTAIVGPSGSGKTTLCNLIARFWDVNSGGISIGGRDVKEYTFDSLLKNISMATTSPKTVWRLMKQKLQSSARYSTEPATVNPFAAFAATSTNEAFAACSEENGVQLTSTRFLEMRNTQETPCFKRPS